MDIYIGLDIGTTHVKSLVLHEDGSILAQASVNTPVSTDAYGQVHRPDHLMEACQTVVKRALSSLPTREAKIRAISVASVGEEGFFVNGEGKPIYPATVWYEQRLSSSVHNWIEDHQSAAGTVGLPLKPSYSLFKWLWMRDCFPELWREAYHWLPISDYVAFRLSGARALSFSQASRTYAFDPFRRRIVDEWLSDVLPRGPETLPPCVPTGSVIGETLPGLVDDWGLPSGVAVVVGGHDHPMGAIGAGVTEESRVLDSMGTAELLYRPLITLAEDAFDGAFEYGYTGFPTGPCYIGAGTYTGMILNTIRRLFNGRVETNGPTEVDQAMVSVVPNQLGSAPYFDIKNVTPTTDFAAVWTAALRASAFVVRWALLHMPVPAHDATVVVIGGAASEEALQIKASVLGREIHVLSGVEAVALGAAVTARSGVLKAPMAKSVPSTTVDPDPSRMAQLEEQYDRFCQMWVRDIREVAK